MLHRQYISCSRLWMKIMIPLFSPSAYSGHSPGATLAARRKQKDISTVSVFIVTHIATATFNTLSLKPPKEILHYFDLARQKDLNPAVARWDCWEKPCSYISSRVIFTVKFLKVSVFNEFFSVPTI